ncbi:MAG: 4Fe-4S dicluster domain-containing protein [Marinilabiliaceae bacterium]|nr:4Fe-4S dicluster domain-containing protein [Marinilabiliaceae bacterium]
MNGVSHIKKQAWHDFLTSLIDAYQIYAPIQKFNTLDYQHLTVEDIPNITYNLPKPITPLKIFFLPVKENVGAELSNSKPSIIIGCPACDLHALDILDEIYLKEPFTDPFYQQKRAQTILIGTDCHATQEHCHCTTYGIDPIPDKHADLLLSVMEDNVILEIKSQKGEALINNLSTTNAPSNKLINKLTTLRETVIHQLHEDHQQLPNYEKTRELIKSSDDFIWEKYSNTCVSCGACATICPTCTCFLLVDRPGFEKVRQIDACQLPGFARIAAGEDPLGSLSTRFKNRYLCKYVWKPEKFKSIACTGCGRCIETCIGNINKNELFMELNDEIKGRTL